MPDRFPNSLGNLTPDVANRAAQGFRDRFARTPKWIAVAPGRVNLIGEHIDYNDGFVLPMAIDRYTAIAADESSTRQIRVASGQMGGELIVDAAALDHGDQPSWTSYVVGPLALCALRGLSVGPIDAFIESDVPTGAGLSSSAALEVAAATLAELVSGTNLEPMAKARLCQQAEHEYAGVPCGIMDQAISVLARAGHAMLLDCRSGETTQVPMDDPDLVVLIANSNVKHTLNDGEYAVRRDQCQQAAAALGQPSLRDVTAEQLAQSQDVMPPVVYQRARHVIGEIARTTAAADALRQNDWDRFGKQMYASHASLRDDYEVSCSELDTLVELAQGMGRSQGVYGSRMTGGGFGGCTVSLVNAQRVATISEQLGTEYQHRTGIEPTIFVTRAAQGAHVVVGND